MDSNQMYRKLMIHQLSNDIRKCGSLSSLELRPPNENEILVKNYFAGVNAIDMNVIMGRSIFFTGELPFDVGMEGLGMIESIGTAINPDKFPIGKIGLVFAKSPKSYSEYVYVKPDEFIAIPELRPEYLPLLDCGLTASIGLEKSGRIKEGDVVLITAAAGGTGHIAVQWAKLKGCKVIGLCSTPQKESFLVSIGCDRVINYRQDNVDEILSREFPSGVDVIWETIGGSMFETLFKHLAIGGRIVIVGAISGYKTVGFPDISIENLPTKLLSKSASIVGFRFRHYEKYFSQYLHDLIELYQNKKLIVRLDTKDANGIPFMGIDSVINAVEHLQSGKNIGKVIVQIRQ